MKLILALSLSALFTSVAAAHGGARRSVRHGSSAVVVIQAPVVYAAPVQTYCDPQPGVAADYAPASYPVEVVSVSYLPTVETGLALGVVVGGDRMHRIGRRDGRGVFGYGCGAQMEQVVVRLQSGTCYTLIQPVSGVTFGCRAWYMAGSTPRVYRR